MDTVWHVRQCEGIICTWMYIYIRWNVDWWPDDRCAGSMPKRMFKIIYSSPYALHETATSSNIVKYWYRITCPSIWKHNVYINVTSRDVRSNSVPRWRCFGFSVYWPHIRHAVLPIDHTHGSPHIQTTAGYAPAQSIAYPSYIRKGWYKQASRKTCKQNHVSR